MLFGLALAHYLTEALKAGATLMMPKVTVTGFQGWLP